MRAETYCARCGVTPYCSVVCQRSDWYDRHRSVCHNLARRLSVADVTDSGAMEIVAPLQLNRPRYDSRPAGDKHSSRPPMRDSESARPQRDNQLSRPPRDNHGSAGPSGDNYGSARPQRDNQSPRTQRDNQGSARPPRDNQSSRPPMRDSQSSRPQMRDNDQVGSNGFNNKKMDQNRGERGGGGGGSRGRNYMPRNELRRPHAANTTPQGSPTDAEEQEQPSRAHESRRPTAVAPPGVATTDQVVKKPDELKTGPRDEPKGTKQFLTVADATPVKKMVPMNCVIETLPVGETFLLSVDAKTSDCRVDTAGYVCLSMHTDVQAVYEALCGPLAEACNNEPAYTPSPGDVFAYFSKDEDAWYRARLVAPNMAALFDGSKVIDIGANAVCRKLPAAYSTQPEFSCVLHCDNATLEQNLQATIISKTPIIRVKLADNMTGEPMGDGTVARWMPKLDYPKTGPRGEPRVDPKQVASVNGDTKPPLPVVSRPDIKNNSRVYLVDSTGFGDTFVRPCDMNEQRAFDGVLQDTALHGLTAKPLTEAPAQGSVVISKFTDGNHYRALVKRTNKEKNRYQLEYLEFGNVHVNQLENLYECPPQLSLQQRPVVTSRVRIGPEDVTYTQAAMEYIEPLKDTAEMLLTTEPGASKVPSGSAANLIVMKGNVNLNARLQQMCKPEWKHLEEAGGNVVAAEKIMYPELEYVKLPREGCELDILDVNNIAAGLVSGCPYGLPHAKYVFNTLTDKMGEYCNSALGRDPYLPATEELCIAQMPPYDQWFRAVMVEQNKVGGSTACVMYVDYGTVEQKLPVSLLRKMMPEFVRGLPAVGVEMKIKDFPNPPTQQQLLAAIEHMQMNEEGRGRLTVTHCKYDETIAAYKVTAPALINAMRQA